MCFHLCSVVPFNHDRMHERARSGAGPQILFFEQSLSCRETHMAGLADELQRLVLVLGVETAILGLM
jgi:hypothetical protein